MTKLVVFVRMSAAGKIQKRVPDSLVASWREWRDVTDKFSTVEAYIADLKVNDPFIDIRIDNATNDPVTNARIDP